MKFAKIVDDHPWLLLEDAIMDLIMLIPHGELRRKASMIARADESDADADALLEEKNDDKEQPRRVLAATASPSVPRLSLHPDSEVDGAAARPGPGPEEVRLESAAAQEVEGAAQKKKTTIRKHKCANEHYVLGVNVFVFYVRVVCCVAFSP